MNQRMSWNFAIKLLLILLVSTLAFTDSVVAEGKMTQAQSIVDSNTSRQAIDIEVFVREGCSHCANAKQFLKTLSLEQPELRIVFRDIIQDSSARERLQELSQAQGVSKLSVPTFYLNGLIIVGYSDDATGNLIRAELAKVRKQQKPHNAPESCAAESSLSCATADSTKTNQPEVFELKLLGRSISLEQTGLPLFTLIMGLLDGFNPCSMWVLILMISLLAPMQNRLKMFAVAGIFIAVEGIAYFIFMAAWLNLFLLIGLSRASEIIIAGVAILAGAINLKDFLAYGWGGISLSIPQSAKPGIYARIRAILQAENLSGAIVGAAVLAVLVQIVEFLCTSGFPALYTRILTLQQLNDVSYYGYLLLYNAAYMLDDMIILSIGIFTLSQRRLQEKEGRWLKLISGVVMVGLGLYLLIASH